MVAGAHGALPSCLLSCFPHSQPLAAPVLSGSFSPVVFSSPSPLLEELAHVIPSSFPPPHGPPLLYLPPGGALAVKGLFLLPRGTLPFPWLQRQSRWAPCRAGSR